MKAHQASRLDEYSQRLRLLNRLPTPQPFGKRQIPNLGRVCRLCFFFASDEDPVSVFKFSAASNRRNGLDASVSATSEAILEYPRVPRAAPSALRPLTATLLYRRELYNVQLAMAQQALAVKAQGQEPRIWILGEVALLAAESFTVKLLLRSTA